MNRVLQAVVLLNDCNFILVVALDVVVNAFRVDFRLERRGVKNRRLGIAQRNNFLVVVNLADNLDNVVRDGGNFIVSEPGIDGTRKTCQINACFLLRIDLSALSGTSHSNRLSFGIACMPLPLPVEDLNSRADDSRHQQARDNQQSCRRSSKDFPPAHKIASKIF